MLSSQAPGRSPGGGFFSTSSEENVQSMLPERFLYMLNFLKAVFKVSDNLTNRTNWHADCSTSQFPRNDPS